MNKLNVLISFIDFSKLSHVETPLYFTESFLVVSPCSDFLNVRT